MFSVKAPTFDSILSPVIKAVKSLDDLAQRKDREVSSIRNEIQRLNEAREDAADRCDEVKLDAAKARRLSAKLAEFLES